MTERQRIFAREYVACGVGSEAYRRAYPRSKAWTALSVEKRASRVLAHVLPLVAELRAKATSAKVMTKQRALEMVTTLADTSDADPRVVLAAVERLAKMQGWDKPQQVEVAEGASVAELARVREVALAMSPEERAEWLKTNMPAEA